MATERAEKLEAAGWFSRLDLIAIVVAAVALLVAMRASVLVDTGPGQDPVAKPQTAIVQLRKGETLQEMCAALGIPLSFCATARVRPDGVVELKFDTDAEISRQ